MSRGKAAGPEAGVLRACLSLLRLHGIPHWRANTGALRNPEGRLVRFGIVGCSDIVGLLPPRGRFLAVETKAPNGRLTDAQAAYLGTVRDAGGVAVVIRDVNTLAYILNVLIHDPAARFTIEGQWDWGPDQ